MPLKLTFKIPSSFGSKLAAQALPELKKVVARALPKVAQGIVTLVAAEARKQLHRTADRYERALNEAGAMTVTDDSIAFTLKDPVVKALENGFKSFDIKTYMLAHGKVSKKGALYADVPFTHEPGAVPAEAKQQIQKTGRAQFSGVARKSSIKRNASGMTLRGGLYTTIRRISTNSPPSSWIHPGFKGLQLFVKLEAKIRLGAARTLVAELALAGWKATVS